MESIIYRIKRHNLNRYYDTITNINNSKNNNNSFYSNINYCTCRDRGLCKVKDNRCCESNTVYKAGVITQPETFYYIGTTANKLKIRINGDTLLYIGK